MQGVELLETTPPETAKEKCVKIGCVVSALLYIGAIATAGATLVYASGGISLILAPYIIHQRKKLTDLEAIKANLDAMQDEMNEFKNTGEELSNTVNELGDVAGKLEDTEQAFDLITQTQGQNIEKVEEQVNENKELLKQYRANLRTVVLSSLLSTIINNDKDGDFKIDGDELPPLIIQMKNIEGVKLNEERFRELIEKTGGEISSVMEIVKDLLRKEDAEAEAAVERKKAISPIISKAKPPEEWVFKIEIKEIEDSDDEDEDESNEPTTEDEVSPLESGEETKEDDKESLSESQ